LQFSWGEPGSGPGQFRLPHAIAVDRRGVVYVADRENSRIQVFKGDGTYITNGSTSSVQMISTLMLTRICLWRSWVLKPV